MQRGLILLALLLGACDGVVGTPPAVTPADAAAMAARDGDVDAGLAREDAAPAEDAAVVGEDAAPADDARAGDDASAVGDDASTPMDADVADAPAGPDAAPGDPDAMPGNPDAAPGNRDAAPGNPDAASTFPDAAPTFPDAALPDAASPPDAGLPAYNVVSRYGRQIVQFAVVQKNNGHERRMYIESSALAQMTPTSNVPNGQIIFMESLNGGTIGTVYIRGKQAGVWNSGSFSPGSPNYTMTPQSGCEGCHGLSRADATYTLPLLRRLIATHGPTTIQCPQDSFNPCPLTVYDGPP